MDIFISYLREDIEAAEKLAEALQAYGWSVFWDRRIPAGKRFDDFLDEQLHAARCVVVLWSRGSINSPWVKDEAAVGRDRGILVPARLDDVLAPFGFRAIQAANLIGWQDDRSQSGFQQLLRDIRAAIEVPARVFAAGMGEPSPLISQPEEAESKQQAEEKERPRRDQAEAVSKRRAEEEEQQRREQKQAEAKRRAAEDEQRQQAEDKHKFEEQAQLKPEATDERTAHKKSSSFVGFVALAIVLLVFGLAAYTTNWFGQPGDDQATTHHAVQGHSEGPGALDQYRLGIIHRDGIDVPQDDTEAVKWFRKAADQGNSDAQNKLGVMYQAGRGVPQDDAEAVKWFHKAADQGNSDAQYNLAVMYQSGRGVLRDDAAAVKWCRKAADQGNAWAQSNLGLMYENGRGVAQDDVEAVKWYRKAADQRNVWAQNNLVS